MKYRFKYVEAIDYANDRLFSPSKVAPWSITLIKQYALSDDYISAVISFIIDRYCMLPTEKSKFICPNNGNLIEEHPYYESWFKNFIMLCDPIINDSGDVTIIKTYKASDASYTRLIDMVRTVD